MPSVSRKSSGSKNHAAQKNDEQVLPHAKIPHADIDWALQQSPTVLRLWVESWRVDSFGTAPSKPKPQWHTLKTKLQGSNLRAAIRSIELMGLFKYEPIQQKSEAGQRKIIGWKCTNLHGYYSGHWKVDFNSVELDDKNVELDGENVEPRDTTDKLDGESVELEAENFTPQKVENSQLLTDYSSIPPQSLTNVIEEESNTPVAITQPPFIGVSAMATNDIDQEEKAEDMPALAASSNVTEDITQPSTQPDLVPLESTAPPVDVEEIRRRTREKLQALNPGGGRRERKVYMSQFARSRC